MRRGHLLLALRLCVTGTGLALLVTGCPPKPPVAPVPLSKNAPPGRFTDRAAAAGIEFRHSNGATGQKRFPEITGSGCAFLDFDQDGWLDILLLDAGALPDGGPTQRNRLYRNTRDGHFEDVTEGSGLARTGYTQGAAVGDFDNDGYPDLYVTAYGGNHLFRNQAGTGKFTDVTVQAGVSDLDQGPRYSLSAAWGDYDRDGWLDLAVCRYARWSPETDKPCRNSLSARSYCSPELYEGDGLRLYRNRGNGTFVESSRSTGLAAFNRRAMGLAWLDYNRDGWQDLFVACDLQPNLLLENGGRGRFREKAVETGVAYGDMGGVLSGMGVAVADYDNDGWDDLHVTNFSHQPNSLFRNVGRGFFENQSVWSGLADPSNPLLGWGCEFLDYDRDGYKDLVVANGHMHEDVAKTVHGVTYQQPKSLYRNNRDGTFAEIRQSVGDLSTATLSRGLAVGDYDNDGGPDVLVNNQNGNAQLLRNEYQGGHWIAFLTQGKQSNRDGMHARIRVRSGKLTQQSEVRAGASFCSSSDRRVHFGLGAASAADVEIRWPSGKSYRARGLAVDRVWRWAEGTSAPQQVRAPGDRKP